MKDEGHLPCAYCDRTFHSENDRVRHIRSVKGHGNKICPNCKETLKTCKDITGIGQAFVCETSMKKYIGDYAKRFYTPFEKQNLLKIEQKKKQMKYLQRLKVRIRNLKIVLQK